MRQKRLRTTRLHYQAVAQRGVLLALRLGTTVPWHYCFNTMQQK